MGSEGREKQCTRDTQEFHFCFLRQYWEIFGGTQKYSKIIININYINTGKYFTKITILGNK